MEYVNTFIAHAIPILAPFAATFLLYLAHRGIKHLEKRLGADMSADLESRADALLGKAISYANQWAKKNAEAKGSDKMEQALNFIEEQAGGDEDLKEWSSAQGEKLAKLIEAELGLQKEK